MQGSFDHLYGGSVAKHTYVAGLSDIDSLFLIDGSEMAGKSPDVVLTKMEGVLARALRGKAAVARGEMAVTVTYDDGTVIQLLPAMKTKEGKLRVPSSRGTNRWSRIDPVAFQTALTGRNGECGGKLVPTIKLAKAIMGGLPEGRRLSGYHMEALAMAAFRGYSGGKDDGRNAASIF